MKKLHKKLLAMLLATGMTLSLFGCAAETPEQTEAAPVIAIPEPEQDNKCTDYGTPLADLRVRRALAHAIDMDTIVEALFFGDAGKAAGFFGAEDLPVYDYDPDKAKVLLAEAGWPSDYVLDVVYYYEDEQTEDFLNVIGNYWDAVGVKAEFRKLDGHVTTELWATPEDMEEGDSAVEWDLLYMGVAALTDAEFYSRFASTSSNNSHTPANEELDQQIRKADYAAAAQILAEQVSFLPLYHSNCFIYVSDHLDTAGAVHGNDQFTYEKDILNWVTDREDETLYTDGGPVDHFCYPVVSPGQHLYQELIFERLLKADHDLNPTEGQIAESHTVSEDGKTVEFVIREELFWHDGEPLTAEDVKFTFELYLKCPGANAVLTGLLERLEGAEEFQNGDAEGCAGITVEENTVTFRFAEASADALKVFAQWPVLPKHKLENVRPDKLQKNKFWNNPIGSGPYRVSEVELGKYCILERWEDYRETGDGNIQYIYMAASEDIDQELAVHADRDRLDYAWGKSTDNVEYVKKLEGIEVETVQVPYTYCFFINQFAHESYHQAEEATEPTE